MLKWLFFIMLVINYLHGFSQQKSITEIKTELEKSPNSPLYVKDVMKKKFILDTIVVTRTTHFSSLADSLAYRGILKKVYGPYRISQIFIDTSIFRYRMADSLGKSILSKLKNNQESFERLAEAYSMGGESITKGDLGWVARGSIIPAIDRQLAKTKKGEVFMVWSSNGLHIIKLTDGPKQDNGAALMMRIFL
jgi:hypothetical protein